MTRNKKLVRLMAISVASATVATSVPAYAAFDAAYYANQNPDVVAAFGNTPKALETHYEAFGKKEGRSSSSEDSWKTFLKSIFDAKFYAKQNPDVVKAFGSDPEVLFQHFINFGIKEGRNINSLFDIKAYMKAYPDLQTAFGNDFSKYYIHFATCGQTEHRTLGGFPSEGIAPGGAKLSAVLAARGGSSGGGGGSKSSGKTDKTAKSAAEVAAEVDAAVAAVEEADAAIKTAQKNSEAIRAKLQELQNDEDPDNLGTIAAAEAKGAVARAGGATDEDKQAAYEAATTALGELEELATEASKALEAAKAAQKQAEDALEIAEAAYATTTEAFDAAMGGLYTEITEASKAVQASQLELDTIIDEIAVLGAVKADDGKYYRAADVVIDEEAGTKVAKDGATEVNKADCIEGVTDAFSTTSDDLDLATATLKAAQKDAIDAYNDTVGDDDKVAYAADFDFATILEDNPAFGTWYDEEYGEKTAVDAAAEDVSEKKDAYDLAEAAKAAKDALKVQKEADKTAAQADYNEKAAILDSLADEYDEVFEKVKEEQPEIFENSDTALDNINAAHNLLTAAGVAVANAETAVEEIKEATEDMEALQEEFSEEAP